MRAVLIFLTYLSYCLCGKTCKESQKQCGFAFGAAEYGSPDLNYNSAQTLTSLSNLANTGASSVRIMLTYFQDNINSTKLHPVTTSGSPIATTSTTDIAKAFSESAIRGLSVFFTPLVDINWDIPTNSRQPHMQGYQTRAMIGQHFTEADWQDWFEEYTTYILNMAEIAQQNKVPQMSVCFGLETALAKQENNNRWANLVTLVKNKFTGKVGIDTNRPLELLPWWSELNQLVDYVGIIGYDTFEPPHNYSVSNIEKGWNKLLMDAKHVKKVTKTLVIMTEIGFQSRPFCYTSPSGLLRLDGKDCSGWLECYDMICQVNAYEGTMRVITEHDALDGIYWWLWRNDPTEGGTSCDQYTPFGKPAESSVRVWFGGMPKDSTTAIMDAIEQNNKKAIGMSNINQDTNQKTITPQRTLTNGYVFGGPDEWSSPYFRYDSAGASDSLRMLKSIGGNAAEFPVMWYYNNNNDTEIYPIESITSSLKTSTIPELTAIITTAKELNMTTCLTPMLDPNYDLPGNCRQCQNPPGPGWRGTIGKYWGNDCSVGSAWYQWHQNYFKWITYYAKFAEQMKVDEFLISHELEIPVRHCPHLWISLIDATRKVFSGTVSVAFTTSIGQPKDGYKNVTWISKLDYIGVDCYYALKGSTHPPLPWQDVNLADLLKRWPPIVQELEAMSKYYTNKPIKCTETGYQSRPWNYAVDWHGVNATHQLDPQDCSVWDQCYSLKAQSLGLDAMLTSLYAQPWFHGFYLWMWRADPTAGGPSDDTFMPNGKPDTVRVLHKHWAGGSQS